MTSLSDHVATLEQRVAQARASELRLMHFLHSVRQDLRMRSRTASSPKVVKRTMEGEEDNGADDSLDEGVDKEDDQIDIKDSEISVIVVARLLAEELQTLPSYKASAQSLRLTRELSVESGSPAHFLFIAHTDRRFSCERA